MTNDKPELAKAITSKKGANEATSVVIAAQPKPQPTVKKDQ